MDIPAYLINLDADQDRLAFMNEQFASLNIRYERISAIRGLQLPEWLRPFFLDDQGELASPFMTPGEVGCYASHLAAMKTIANGNRPALVLEDDVLLKLELPALIKEFLALDMPFDMLRLSCTRKKRLAVTVCRLSDGYRVVRYLRMPMSTGGYLITPDAARRFLDWKQERLYPVDLDMKSVWLHKLNILAVYPKLISHDVPLHSAIDTAGFSRTYRHGTALSRMINSVKRLHHVVQVLRKTA